MKKRIGRLAEAGKSATYRRVQSASESVLEALPDILALSPTSSIAIVFTFIAISRSRLHAEGMEEPLGRESAAPLF